ncbi:putative quinol monooxygenase [Vibrio variabilis]|uniref:putative quinol monooxygenase n=1 Tax=Vibrio variabilis TaxID=990271 RepID=UPI000DD8FFDF|nr:antibiotic biosynthesis monooxygenase [Vibrio variabilis]
MPKTILKGYIEVPEDELSVVIKALHQHKALTHAEPGCLVFTVEQDVNEPTRFSVYEEFVDKAAFEHHQARVADSDWGRVTGNVKRFYTVVTEAE